MGMPRVGGALVCEFSCGLDVQLPHQPINPLSGADHFPPDHVKQGVQSRGWLLLLMQGNKLTGQPLILLFSGADAPMKPGVVAAAGDFQKPAELIHRDSRRCRLDESVLVLYGLESMPTDFF